MEKSIESDINITNVVNRVVDEVVVIDEVPVVEDVQVQVSDSVVVDGVVEPHAVVVNVDHV